MFFTAKNYLALYQQKLFSPVFSVVLAVNCRTVLACASRRPRLPLHLTAVPARGAAVHACHYALIGQCRLSTYYTLWLYDVHHDPGRGLYDVHHGPGPDCSYVETC